MTQPATTARVVVGTLTGVEPRNGGWFRYSVQEQGKQYPTKADTKKPELINQLNTLFGQMVTVKIGDVQSTNINPNTGQPYVNHYLNEVAVGAQAQASPQQQQPTTMSPQTQQVAQPQQVVQPPQAFVGAGDEVRELRIMRIAASKNAIEMAAAGRLGDNPTPKEMVEAAEVWVAYFTLGPARFGVQAGNVVEAPPAEPVQQSFNDELVCNVCGFKGGHHAAGCPEELPF